MRNSFLVSIKCPECGGPLRYPEGAFTFKCSFCNSVLRTQTDRVTLKYIIPCPLDQKNILIAIKKIIASKKNLPRKFKTIKQIKTYYKPFWYFKGMIYSCHSSKGKHEVEAKTWYYTFPADHSFVPSFQSLGIRSEVLTIEPYDSEMFQKKEIALPLTIDKNAAEKKAELLANKKIDYSQLFKNHPKTSIVAKLLAEKKTDPSLLFSNYSKTSIIGERFFIIYYPVIKITCAGGDYCHTFMLDGINKNLLDEYEGKHNVVASKNEKLTSYHITFLSHRCKNCGNDLEPRDFDIIFYCKNCFRLWLLKGKDYYSQKIRILETPKRENTIFLPFWRFEVIITSKSTNLKIKTIGDLSKFMKMGLHMLRNENQDRPVRFYVPALVTRNARAIIKLAAKIGIKQKELPVSETEDFPSENIWNASLPEEEAEEMLEPLIFLVVGLAHRKAINFYKDFKIKVTDKQLVYYPFEDKGNFMLDHFHNYNFPKRSFDLNVY